MPLLTLVFIYLHFIESSAQELSCDPNLSSPPNNPYGYRLRGDRCEGTYVQQLAGGSAFLMVSLNANFETQDLGRIDPLIITWKPFPGENEPIRLRAIGLRRRLYYRMDTIRPPGSEKYEWPTDVIRALNLSLPDIGLVAFTSVRIGQNTIEVYLPLGIAQDKQVLEPERYKIILYPRRELKEAFLHLISLNENGMPKEIILDGVPLRYGFYPAERSQIVRLPKLETEGLYKLGIGANLSGGGSSYDEIFFYHPKY